MSKRRYTAEFKADFIHNPAANYVSMHFHPTAQWGPLVDIRLKQVGTIQLPL